MNERPNWNNYFMRFAQLAQSRSTCLRRQVGAVIVKNRMILTTGYNGAPKGVSHCVESKCIRREQNVPSGQRHELCRGLHAEQNAIIQAATSGVNIDGATLYSTHFPCSLCVKMILNSGIKKVFYLDGYPDYLAKTMAETGSLEIIQFDQKGIADK